MRENLGNFLVDIASDPDRLALFALNPSSLLDDADLTDKEKAAVLTRDSRQVAAALGESGYALGDVSHGIVPAKKAPAKRTPKKKAPKKAPPKRKPGGKKR